MISINPTALVASKRIGERTNIWAFCNTLEEAAIGRACNIRDRCFIENDVVIGDRVTVKCGVSLYEGLRLEDDVFVGPDVSFSNDPRPGSGTYLSFHPKTVMQTGASVVTLDVPDFALVYGSLARRQGSVCRCGATLRFTDGSAACGCGRRYSLGPEDAVVEA